MNNNKIKEIIEVSFCNHCPGLKDICDNKGIDILKFIIEAVSDKVKMMELYDTDKITEQIMDKYKEVFEKLSNT